MKTLFPSWGALSAELRTTFSRSDLLVVPLLFLALVLLTVAFRGAAAPFNAATPDLTVSLDPRNLPYYGLRTVARMVLAVLCSLLFTLVYATAAAKSRRAEKVLIPILDFLQSLPILGFLTVTTVIFLGIFRGSLLGLEAASVFAIFTSQVWNMTFSFYHAQRTLPRELLEASAVMRQSPWQRFWTLEVPFAIPGLVWNTMMSVSGGWFFVVAAEVITVVGRDQPQSLPGIGSYIAQAIAVADVRAMAYAALALLLLILLYDQLVFRPIVAWAEKFKFEQSQAQETPHSWMLDLLRRSRLAARVAYLFAPLGERIWQRSAAPDAPGRPVEPPRVIVRRDRTLDWSWHLLTLTISGSLLFLMAHFLFGPQLGVADGALLAANSNVNAHLDPALAARFRLAGVRVGLDQTVYLSDLCAASQRGTELSSDLRALLTAPGAAAPANLPLACAQQMVPPGNVAISEIGEVALRGGATLLRVIVLICLATLFWTPIGVWIGLRPWAAQFVQPLAQFAAAFPANLVFPLAVVLIAHFKLAPSVFLSPLMVLGTQWYILFNVIAGTVAIPNDLKEAAQVTGLRGWNRWREFIIPAIFPAFVTGGITASGGSWNASIVAELVSWGSVTLVAYGLGSYIAAWSTGEFNPHVALGMLMMGLLVLSTNRLLWRRLYVLAETRFRLA